MAHSCVTYCDAYHTERYCTATGGTKQVNRINHHPEPYFFARVRRRWNGSMYKQPSCVSPPFQPASRKIVYFRTSINATYRPLVPRSRGNALNNERVVSSFSVPYIRSRLSVSFRARSMRRNTAIEIRRQSYELSRFSARV